MRAFGEVERLLTAREPMLVQFYARVNTNASPLWVTDDVQIERDFRKVPTAVEATMWT